MTDNQTSEGVELEIIKASEVTPKEVKWLWYPFIPYGKVTLLQGGPGDGKSAFLFFSKGVKSAIKKAASVRRPPSAFMGFAPVPARALPRGRTYAFWRGSRPCP